MIEARSYMEIDGQECLFPETWNICRTSDPDPQLWPVTLCRICKPLS